MADHLIAIQDAKDSDELKAAYTAAYKACGTDANWQKKVIAAKDEKKALLVAVSDSVKQVVNEVRKIEK
jgi:hypothetical protein